MLDFSKKYLFSMRHITSPVDVEEITICKVELVDSKKGIVKISADNYFTKYIIVDYFDWLVYTGKAKVVKE